MSDIRNSLSGDTKESRERFRDNWARCFGEEAQSPKELSIDEIVARELSIAEIEEEAKRQKAALVDLVLAWILAGHRGDEGRISQGVPRSEQR